MTPQDYQLATGRTWEPKEVQYQKIVSSLLDPDNFTTNKTAQTLHAAIGIAGEAGELLGGIKKHIFYSKPLDKDNIVEECGDLLYYISEILTSIDMTLDDCMILNLSKLRKRYPNGFTDHHAQQRLDKIGEQDE